MLKKEGCWKDIKSFTALNRWLRCTEQILSQVHWTRLVTDWSGGKRRRAVDRFHFDCVRPLRCQFGLTIMCVFYIFIEFKLLSHYWHICCMIIFGRDWNIWRNMYFEQQIRSDLHQFTFLGSTLKALLNGNFLNQFYRSLDIKLEYSWRPWNVYSCLEFMHFDCEVST